VANPNGIVRAFFEASPLLDETGTRFPFVVNARALHRDLEIGRDFSTWIKDRIAKFQLIEGKDYGVFPELGENPLGGRPAKEYYLTLIVARWLATDVGTEKGGRSSRSWWPGTNIPPGGHRKLQ
jgi:phage anti-repressor protein